ncbi:hypothetical protein F4782DRAFT_551192 [Xylaria castorea]|nr:hypothetical protein F4782DRAFT_551192 [Xylaria castorea]
MAAQSGSQREHLLSLKLDDPERKRLIRRKANSIRGGPIGHEHGMYWKGKSRWLNIGFEGELGRGFSMDEVQFLENFAAHQQHEIRLRNINKIVCFGLGSPQVCLDPCAGDEPYGAMMAWRSYCQYATALELAKLFKEFNGMVFTPNDESKTLSESLLNEFIEVPCNAFRDDWITYGGEEDYAPLAQAKLLIPRLKTISAPKPA